MSKETHRRRWRSVVASVVAVVASVGILTTMQADAAAPGPIAVTPYAGFNAQLTRAPYVTDLGQSTADVNWASTSSTPGSLEWGPLGNCTAHRATVPATLPNSQPAAGTPTSITAPEFNVVSTPNEYQSTVVLGGLTPSTTYCYRPLSSSSVDLLGTNSSPVFTTLDPANSSTPLTFDVLGDLGETYYSAGVNFPNNLNTDQAAIDSLVGSSGAKFVVTAGDVAYSGGTQANYGDLVNSGTEVSDIFGPSYWAETGGLPVFAGEGNHGQNTVGLRSWPESNIAASAGGVYAYDSYPAPTQDGTSPGSYPDAWYAISDANVRLYVLDAAWADGSNVGNATGSACTSAGEAACPGYQVDHDEHWSTSSPEYKWLAADLASHPGTVKMAVWHYPLRSDQSSQDSDVYLQNSSSNPYQSSNLESLLATNGVKVVFNGHAHDYQRITPSGSGHVTNYVTGGGGSILEPVSTGSGACSAFQGAGSIYAIGWSPTKNSGTACGSGVPTPQSAAQVYNFLKVTVNGGTVTVTPINAAGQSFDVQQYTYPTAAVTVIDTQPPSLTNSTSATVAFHSTAGPSTFTCRLDLATATSCTSPTTYTGLSEGAHTITVTGAGATPATANWTVDTTPPTAPTHVMANATSATSVSLAWMASTDSNGVTGYNVFRNGVLLTPAPVATASYTDSTASPGATYQYTVDAVDGAGNTSSMSTPPTPVTMPLGATGPSLVQTAGSSTTTVTLPVPSAPGDLLVLSASLYTGASHQITAVSDGTNTWKKVGAYDVSGANSEGELWYAANASSVSKVTVTTGASTVALRLDEFSGVATSSPLDGSNGTAGQSTAASAGTATPTGVGDLAVGFIAGHSTSQSIAVTSAGFAAQPMQTTTSPSTVTLVGAYQDLSSTGAQGFAGSFPTTMYWAAGIALFKAGAQPPPPGDFSISAAPTSQTVTAGAPASATIGTVAIGTPQPVALSASGAPTGALVSFSPQSVTSGDAGSTMTITTSTSTPAGTYPITVTGTGTSAVHATSFSLTVNPAPVAPAITSANATTFTEGVAGTFTVTSTGNPTAGLSESGSLPSNVTLVDNGDGTATLAGTPATGTAASYPITITATNGVGSPANQSFTLTVKPAASDFSISAAPTSQTVTAGAPASATIGTVAIGTPQPVALSASGAPTGALVSFSPQSVTSGDAGSTMTITTSTSTPAGTYPITVTGTGTSAVHATSFSLTVNPAPVAPAITSANATTFTEGVAGTFTVTSTGNPTAGLSESGSLPSNVTLVDNGDGTATLAGTPATGTAASYPITITATNGVGSPANQSFTLTVKPAASDFSISAAPTSQTVTAGAPASATIGTVAIGTPQPVALSASGAPTGALVSFSPQSVTSGDAGSTMTITTSTSTPAGTYPITVTGTGTSAVHATSFSLTVNPGTSAPQLVQVTGAASGATTAALTGTFPLPTTVGDLLVVSASVYTGATNHITSVTDSAGDIWTRVGAADVSGHNSDGELWYAAGAASVTSVTVHVASAASVALEAQEFSGVATTAALDTSAVASNTGTSAASGQASPSVANELVVGFVAGHANAEAISLTTPGISPQPQQTSASPVATVAAGYVVLGAPSARNLTGSFPTAMYWAAGIALFKPAA